MVRHSATSRFRCLKLFNSHMNFRKSFTSTGPFRTQIIKSKSFRSRFMKCSHDFMAFFQSVLQARKWEKNICRLFHLWQSVKFISIRSQDINMRNHHHNRFLIYTINSETSSCWLECQYQIGMLMFSDSLRYVNFHSV